MRESYESSKDFSQAVKCLYDYYRWISRWPPLMRYPHLSIINSYDPKTSQFLHLFLTENNMIKIEGNSLTVIDTLPPQLVLLNLCNDFFIRHPDYIFIPSICEILPNSLSQQLPARMNNGSPNFFQGKVTPTIFITSREQRLSTIIPQFSSIFIPEQILSPRPKMNVSKKGPKLRIDNWPVEDFINSIRLLHNFYDKNFPNNYKVKTLWQIASLNKFTWSKSPTSHLRIIKMFNRFLTTYDFISQKKSLLISIRINKELPSDAQLRDLFEQFKELPSFKDERSSPQTLLPPQL